MVLSLAVLQAEVGDLDSRDEFHLLGGRHLVQLGQDLPGVGGERHQHRQVTERHQRDVRLGVGAGLGVGDQVHCVLAARNDR